MSLFLCFVLFSLIIITTNYSFSASGFEFTLILVCRRMTTFVLDLVACLAVLCITALSAGDELIVNITILQIATVQGAGNHLIDRKI